MANSKISMKHVAIDKANARMVATVAICTFVVIFSLVAARSVWSQTRYQAKVIGVKSKAHQQLEKNLKAFDSLAATYKAFDGTSTNIIGGISSGTSDKDGTNSKIILNALPSTYDFPALTSSLEKIFKDQGLSVSSISGTDDELNQKSNTASPEPEVVEIPFSFSINNADYSTIEKLAGRLERSIRPIHIDTMTLSGGASDMTVSVTAHTYYQPAKSVSITKKVVK